MVRVTFTVPVPVNAPAPDITSAAAGLNTPVESAKVIVPATAKPPPLEVTVAPVATVKLFKVIAVAPEFTIELLLFIVTVPVGEKVLPEFTVNAPPTEKFAEGCAAGVAAIVRPENFIVPGVAAIVNVVALIVTVPPPDASKVEPEGTVRVLAMLKLDELVTVEEAASVRLAKVSVPPEFTI